VQCDFRIVCYDALARLLTAQVASSATPPPQPPTPNGNTCPTPMSRASLLALRNANGLSKDCDYVINDFVQGNLLAGTLIHLQAVSSSQLSLQVNVATAFDNVAWSGIYDIDANVFRELRDSLGNIVRQSAGSSGSLVTSFDWGNPNYVGNLIEDTTWNVPVGGTRPIVRSTFTDGTVFTVVNWGAGAITDTTFSGCAITFNTAQPLTFTSSQLTNNVVMNANSNVSVIVLNSTLRDNFTIIPEGTGVITLDRVSATSGYVEIASGAAGNINVERSFIAGNGFIRIVGSVEGTINVIQSTVSNASYIEKTGAASRGNIDVEISSVISSS